MKSLLQKFLNPQQSLALIFLCCSVGPIILKAQVSIGKFQNKVNGTVNDIKVADGIVYLGGEFTKAGNIGSYGTALNPTTGLVPSDFPQINGTVNIAIPDGSGGYYVGGVFTQV